MKEQHDDAPENKHIIELFITVKSSIAEIWNAITDSDELENWWGDDVTLEPRVGGKFSEPWEDDDRNKQLASGKVLAVTNQKEITFTWKEQDWEKGAKTQCTISIEDKGKYREISLTHSGWETLPPDKQKQMMKDFKIGWNYHLKELQAYLEQ